MLDQLIGSWDKLERSQRVSLIALAAILVVGLAAMGYWVSRPSFTVLYTGLSPEDAASVVEELREKGVAYRLTAGGSTVEVPYEQLYEMRLQLAGKGMPSSSVVGFELFDRASFSASDLQNNVNYQRALQGELERTIMSMQEITAARVHLALPEERLFTDDQQEASASVVLGVSGKLSPSHVSAISQLVASAVPNLNAKAVTVVDTSGRVLSGGWDEAGGLQTLAQLQARRAYEDRLRERLQSMLDAVLGRHRSVVRVQAELDFQSEETSRETLESPRDQAMVTREETTEESYTGRGSETGGPAGLASSGARSAATTGGSYEHKQESREYEYSRNVAHLRKPPGQLKRLTVAVALDEEIEGSPETKVRELVTAAAGISPERGDQVTVEIMPIDALKTAEEQDKLAVAADAERAKSQSMRTAMRYGSFLLMAAMVAAALMMLSKRLSALPTPEPRAQSAPAGSQTNAGGGAASPGDGIEIPPMNVTKLRQAADLDQPLVEELSSLGNDTPDDFARQLRTWMKPEDGGTS
jgi:flagellar M-ring protein FliF